MKLGQPKGIRNAVMTAAGLLGLGYETLHTGDPNAPTLILAFLGLTGTPLFLNKDDKLKPPADPPPAPPVVVTKQEPAP